MRQHAKIAKAQAKARAEWRAMTRSERRRALRRERRAARRKYARARAAADEPSEVGSWDPPFVTASNYKGYAVHAAMLPTGKVLMWGMQGGVLGSDTYAWLWDPAEGYGRDAFRDVTPTDASGANIPIFCSGMSFLPDGRLLVVGGTLASGSESETDAYTGWAGTRRGGRVRSRHGNLDRAAASFRLRRALVSDPGSAPGRPHARHQRLQATTRRGAS